MSGIFGHCAWQVEPYQGILVVEEDSPLDGCVSIRAPGQDGFAPGHAHIIVQLPCSISDGIVVHTPYHVKE